LFKQHQTFAVWVYWLGNYCFWAIQTNLLFKQLTTVLSIAPY